MIANMEPQYGRPFVTSRHEQSRESESEYFMKLENEYGAHNYHPIPVVITKGKGIYLWDVEGNRYVDFLSAYSAVNQGHCHDRLIAAMTKQAAQLTLCSRAYHNDKLGLFERVLCETFGYEMCLCMNSGAEGVESAIKLARKWGYLKKKIPKDQAMIFACDGNFHGRTMGVISMSTSLEAIEHFGPLLPGVGPICPVSGRPLRYGNIDDLRAAFDQHGPRVAAFIVEPIQGEAGVILPPDNYLQLAAEECRKHNVLFIADEIQTGLGRTGRMLTCDYEAVKPDVVILGKALSGGFYPVSAVLTSKEIMLCIGPGEHGSTFGGNPLACAVGMEALQIIQDEKLADNSCKMGCYFRDLLQGLDFGFVREIRGKGLLNAMELDEYVGKNRLTAFDLCLVLKDNGLLAKPTRKNIIRFAPPLTISREQIEACFQVIKKSMLQFAQLSEQ